MQPVRMTAEKCLIRSVIDTRQYGTAIAPHAGHIFDIQHVGIENDAIAFAQNEFSRLFIEKDIALNKHRGVGVPRQDLSQKMIVGLPNGVRHREKYDIAVKIIDLRKKLRLGEFVARAIDKNRFIRVPRRTESLGPPTPV